MASDINALASRWNEQHDFYASLADSDKADWLANFAILLERIQDQSGPLSAMPPSEMEKHLTQTQTLASDDPDGVLRKVYGAAAILLETWLTPGVAARELEETILLSWPKGRKVAIQLGATQLLSTDGERLLQDVGMGMTYRRMLTELMPAGLVRNARQAAEMFNDRNYSDDQWAALRKAYEAWWSALPKGLEAAQ